MKPATTAPRNFPAWPAPLIGALLCLILGSAGGILFSGGSSEWYRALRPPPGTPPPWLFGPVWSVLYALMGIAAGILWNHRNRPALRAFALQLLLNLSWTPVFFGAQRILPALLVIVGLAAAIVATMILARSNGPLPVLLLAPYLAWVGYATYLNAGFAWLNR